MNLHSESNIFIFGEMLFDCFPSGDKRLGGAPFNVAWNLAQFGLRPQLISAVGQDELGSNIFEKICSVNINTTYVQKLADLPTGKVTIVNNNGEPDYDIAYPSAWDAIDPPRLPTIKPDDLLYYGTLATRDKRSFETLHTLLSERPTRFMDVNLRAPWWDLERTRTLMRFCDYVKLNLSELYALAPEHLRERFSSANEHDHAEFAQAFQQEFDIVHLLITLGEKGAAYIDPTGEYHFAAAKPIGAEIEDTVGAGDAFSSVIILALLQGWEWQSALIHAQEFASFVVSQQGATCENQSIYNDFMSLWGLPG